MLFNASSLFQLFGKNDLLLVIFLPYCFELWPLVSSRITPTFMSMTVDSSMFVWFDSLCPSQQFFSHVRTGLPGLSQYYEADKGQNTVTLLAVMLKPETLISPVKHSTS